MEKTHHGVTETLRKGPRKSEIDDTIPDWYGICVAVVNLIFARTVCEKRQSNYKLTWRWGRYFKVKDSVCQGDVNLTLEIQEKD